MTVSERLQELLEAELLVVDLKQELFEIKVLLGLGVDPVELVDVVEDVEEVV